MTTPRKLIQNAAWVPELGRWFKSRNTHDCVMIKLADGKWVSIDGGPSYAHYGGDLELFENGRVVIECLYEDDPFEKLCAKLIWGTYGKDGKQPLRYLPLTERDSDHLNAILMNVPLLHPLYERVIRHLLKEREA